MLLAGLGAFIGAGWLFTHRPNALARAGAIGLGAVGVGCLALGTILPLFLGARPSLGRPSTTARLEIVSPTPGQVFHGDPAPIHVELRVDGGQVVPFTSLRLVPNEGHTHLYLDGSLVSMTTGLDADLAARTGHHELEAEFVAVHHAPFDPPVRASVTFEVSA